MPIEIERKFLVTNDSWRAAAHQVVPMAQGYINDQAAMDGGAQRASVRVHIAGAEAFLNIKSREAGHTRQEFDYPIPVEDGRALLALCVGGLIDKRRHYVDHAGHLWAVGGFFGDKAGLVVAEVELDSADVRYEHTPWRGAGAHAAAPHSNLAPTPPPSTLSSC